VLAGRQPQDVDGVPALGAVDEQLVGLGQRLDDEHGRAAQLGDAGLGRRHALSVR
jgi:hypothetical protein